MSSEKRSLAAIMFTDIVGYTALVQRDERLALELLEEHARLLRERFGRLLAKIGLADQPAVVPFSSLKPALSLSECGCRICVGGQSAFGDRARGRWTLDRGNTRPAGCDGLRRYSEGGRLPGSGPCLACHG